MAEILQTLAELGWPFTVIILGITFLLLFRPQVGNLISRIRSVTKEGIKAEPPPEAQNEEKRKLAVEQLMNLGHSVTRDDQEKIIIADLEKQSLDTSGDTVRVLVRHLAAMQIAVDFLQIYSSIFGGQISILKQLNQVAGAGLSEEDVSALYIVFKTLAKGILDDWDLQRYLTYLHNNRLITESNSKLHITHKGQDFLLWITKSGLPENKGLL